MVCREVWLLALFFYCDTFDLFAASALCFAAQCNTDKFARIPVWVVEQGVNLLLQVYVAPCQLVDWCSRGGGCSSSVRECTWQLARTMRDGGAGMQMYMRFVLLFQAEHTWKYDVGNVT